jgi:hypothetical protein
MRSTRQTTPQERSPAANERQPSAGSRSQPKPSVSARSGSSCTCSHRSGAQHDLRRHRGVVEAPALTGGALGVVAELHAVVGHVDLRRIELHARWWRRDLESAIAHRGSDRIHGGRERRCGLRGIAGLDEVRVLAAACRGDGIEIADEIGAGRWVLHADDVGAPDLGEREPGQLDETDPPGEALGRLTQQLRRRAAEDEKTSGERPPVGEDPEHGEELRHALHFVRARAAVRASSSAARGVGHRADPRDRTVPLACSSRALAARGWSSPTVAAEQGRISAATPRPDRGAAAWVEARALAPTRGAASP